LAARAGGDAGILLLVLERIRRAVRRALIEPEAVALRIRPGRLDEARLVDQPEILPAVVTARLERRMRRHRLQEIERPERGRDEPVPEAIVAGGPDDPAVASLDL